MSFGVTGGGGNGASVNADGQMSVILGGVVDELNSSCVNLAADGDFTGQAVEILDFAIIYVSVHCDQDSAVDGLSIQQSVDGSDWVYTDEYSIYANNSKRYSINPTNKYFRVVYTNGALDQTHFDLTVIKKYTNSLPSSHSITGAISPEDDAQLVKSVITGVRDDGIFGNAMLDNGNNLRVNSFPYTYSIAEGAISGHDALLKFGTRTAITANTPSVIWEGNTALYTYMTTAQQLKVSSSSANDIATTGTGARTLTIVGQDINCNEITETINMNGTNVVTTTLSYYRIYRAYVYACGTLYTNEGKITITNNAGTVEQAVINAGDAQTLMTIWTVPAGKYAYILNGTLSTDSNKGARVSLFTRQLDGGILYPWQIKYRAFLFGGANSFPFSIPFKIQPKTDIEVRVNTPASAGTTGAGSTFELWYENVG